jgi:6-phosphogluconate dehydrogenase
MKIGIIGLGKMGSNLTRRLMRGGHECVVYDVKPENVKALAKEGATPTSSIDEFVKALPKSRVVWVMVPAGKITESTVLQLNDRLEKGDTLVDGGNSFFKDDVRRSKILEAKGIQYMDVGTSGGVWGVERGYCLMIGGKEQAFRQLEPVFSTLAPGAGAVAKTPGRKNVSTADKGYLYCGPVGAGHFVKMVHNGIEYGLMQAFAEGYDILKNSSSEEVSEDYRYKLDLDEISEVWRRGSVISSWLLDLLAEAMNEDPLLSKYVGFVHDSGEGRWTVQAAIEESVSADVISAALFARFRSRKEHTFGEKVLSAMRNEFGGHVEESSPEKVQREKRKAG